MDATLRRPWLVGARASGRVDDLVYNSYPEVMTDTTTIRISRATHDELKQLASDRHQTVAETVARAVRLLRQDRIGRDLAEPLTDEEVDWLDADAG
jgi:hypothetical protein